jgi:sigma-B regulation protein RsbU (phosphoserine phosphatase)
MPIRYKLILAIAAPLVVLLAALLWFDYRRLRAAAYESTSARISETAQHFAAAFDADFRAIAQVAASTARFLETAGRLSEPQLYEILRRNVEFDSLIYGSCIAFEPGAFPRAASAPPLAIDIPEAPGPKPRPNPDLYCPYVYRGGGGLVRMDVADAYDYLEPKWEWYRFPRETHRPFWTEPFFDEGAGNVEMVTYVAPFFAVDVATGRKTFRGTVTVDVELEKLRRRALATMPVGTGLYIVSREGRFIVAPAIGWVMRESVFSIAERYRLPEIRSIGERMMRGERGVATMPSIDQSGPALAFFAPISSNGWSLAGIAYESDIMADVNRILGLRVALGLAVIVVIVAIIIVMGTWIVRPVGSLAAAVDRLAAGDLDARAAGVHGKDELGRLAAGFNSMVRSLREQMEARALETARREAVESELRVARDIQTSLLPRNFPPFPDRCDFDLYGASDPARYVGGDFFDFFLLDPHRLALLIADVSGKGVPAAIFMAVARTLIRDLAVRGLSPGETLTEANRVLLENNSEGLFVTLFLAHYDTRSGGILYSNAGHLPPFHIAAGGGIRSVARSTGTVLGALPDQRFSEGSIELGPEESLVLYTDGVVEARSPEGEFFRESRFQAMLESMPHVPPRQVCESAIAAVRAFQSGELHDDVTLLVLRRGSGA